MGWRVRPCGAPAKAAASKAAAEASAEAAAEASASKAAAEPVSVEEPSVDKQPVAKPSAAPAPAAPAAPTREKRADVNAWSEPESEAETRRIPQIGISAPCRRTPNVGRLVDRNVDYLRVSRLDFDRALAIFDGRRYHLLRS